MAENKLRELQNLVLRLHEQMTQDFGNRGPTLGLALFLGRHYADSRTLFCGINPGYIYHDPSVVVELGSDNVPFEIQLPCDHAYWRNCSKFLSDHAELREWFIKGVTSTFLVPWRTRDSRELWTLNERTSGKVFDYSKLILRQMIADHEANRLIVAGVEGLRLLNRILGCGWTDSDIRNADPDARRGTYQWRTMTFQMDQPSSSTEDRVPASIHVIQVPHFSRASSRDLMKPCAQWLMRELGIGSTFDVP